MPGRALNGRGSVVGRRVLVFRVCFPGAGTALGLVDGRCLRRLFVACWGRLFSSSHDFHLPGASVGETALPRPGLQTPLPVQVKG